MHNGSAPSRNRERAENLVGAAGNKRAGSRDQGQRPTSACMEQGSSAGAPGNKRAGGESGGLQVSSAQVERGQRVTARMRRGWSAGAAGNGRMGREIERTGGGHRTGMVQAGAEAASNERILGRESSAGAAGDSVPGGGGVGCRRRKSEVKGGIGGDIRYAGWARMRGNKQVRR
ncbi:hypothetical protein DFH08DRAFT_930904 [Mycena albidolilacea]|uniref:Uncharacterized protein n=1 Tax=Mycena albidolilacea TaxID=1033008 RepID=A0AAD7AM01_9AGAR|nr:hypothetical protein DFH08DRAFT_930904 [Mycena albidolilacea]